MSYCSECGSKDASDLHHVLLFDSFYGGEFFDCVCSKCLPGVKNMHEVWIECRSVEDLKVELLKRAL